MPGMTLPPGFRFHPTDEELVDHYLTNRVKGIPLSYKVIADVDLYKCEPWDLPSKSSLPQVDHEWFFFSPRDRKYPNGSRTNRATEAGYWKATGRDRTVRKDSKKVIGMKKTLVFYRGRAPHGERTDWLMHEYRLDGEEFQKMNVPQDAFVLCRVFKKNGFPPPKNPSGGSGSMEEAVDQVDSPGEVKSSLFTENDVKPSMTSLANLAPLAQQLSSPQEGLSENHIMNGAVDNYVGRPSSGYMEDLFAPTGSFNRQTQQQTRTSEADNSEFSLDEGLEKRNHQKLLDDFYAICPPLDGGGIAPLDDEDPYNDIPGLIDSTKNVRTEFNNKWQEQVAYQEQVNGVYHTWDGGQSLPKHEDQLIFPPYENDFGPLPTLVQLPSPPTQTSSMDDNDTESSSVPSSNNHFSTFQIRTRPSVTSPIVAGTYSSQWTAKRRVLLQHRGTTFTPVPPVDVASGKPSEAMSPLVSKAEVVEPKLSSDTQATSSEVSKVDSEVANSQDSTWATNAISAPLSDDSSDDRGYDVTRSLVAASDFATERLIQRALNIPVSSQPFSDDISSVYKVSSHTSPSVVDVGSRDFDRDNGREKQECVSEIESGNSSVAHASTQDVDQSNCRTSETGETAVYKMGESSGFLKKGLVNESRVMRYMGLGLFEPIAALRDASAGSYSSASSKQQVTSRELPTGIGSIHVNAVTVTCSCSSAGRPHVPTKACACYPTFWEGRCENDISTKQDCSEAQRLETRDGTLPRFTRYRVFGCLSLLLVVQIGFSILEYRRGHYSLLLHFRDSDLSERFFDSLPRLFRDLLFATFGATFLYLFQRRSVPWRSIFLRRAVNSELSAAGIF
ncbi:hypothetical protein Mapa_002101 [Marchantia paleacea]|nr:hypothetical protein Mapa_002101 [Marchantia paleacea]